MKYTKNKLCIEGVFFLQDYIEMHGKKKKNFADKWWFIHSIVLSSYIFYSCYNTKHDHTVKEFNIKEAVVVI